MGFVLLILIGNNHLDVTYNSFYSYNKAYFKTTRKYHTKNHHFSLQTKFLSNFKKSKTTSQCHLLLDA